MSEKLPEKISRREFLNSLFLLLSSSLLTTLFGCNSEPPPESQPTPEPTPKPTPESTPESTPEPAETTPYTIEFDTGLSNISEISIENLKEIIEEAIEHFNDILGRSDYSTDFTTLQEGTTLKVKILQKDENFLGFHSYPTTDEKGEKTYEIKIYIRIVIDNLGILFPEKDTQNVTEEEINEFVYAVMVHELFHHLSYVESYDENFHYKYIHLFADLLVDFDNPHSKLRIREFFNKRIKEGENFARNWGFIAWILETIHGNNNNFDYKIETLNLWKELYERNSTNTDTKIIDLLKSKISQNSEFSKAINDIHTDEDLFVFWALLVFTEKINPSNLSLQKHKKYINEDVFEKLNNIDESSQSLTIGEELKHETEFKVIKAFCRGENQDSDYTVQKYVKFEYDDSVFDIFYLDENNNNKMVKIERHSQIYLPANVNMYFLVIAKQDNQNGEKVVANII